MTLEQSCEAAILEYAPYYKQLEAIQTGEHKEYIDVVITFHKTHYSDLKASGATEWTDLPGDCIDYLNENMPYTV